jgi:hypothetical protein
MRSIQRRNKSQPKSCSALFAKKNVFQLEQIENLEYFQWDSYQVPPPPQMDRFAKQKKPVTLFMTKCVKNVQTNFQEDGPVLERKLFVLKDARNLLKEWAKVVQDVLQKKEFAGHVQGKWSVVDRTGNCTTIEINNVKFGIRSANNFCLKEFSPLNSCGSTIVHFLP